jgi:hypothetical protein
VQRREPEYQHRPTEEQRWRYGGPGREQRRQMQRELGEPALIGPGRELEQRPALVGPPPR